MRKVILGISVSSDGFFEGPDGDLDWLNVGGSVRDWIQFLRTFDTVFYGRKAYEEVGIRCPFDGIRKYVFTRTRKHVAGNGMVIGENLEEEVRRIRGEDGKNIWFCGGADSMRTVAALDLIDAYMIAIHPVRLRSGTPLFGGGRPLHLSLINEHHTKSGLVVQHYLPHSRLVNEHHDRDI